MPETCGFFFERGKKPQVPAKISAWACATNSRAPFFINGEVADLYQTGNLFLQFAGFRQRNPAMTAVNMWPQSRNLGTEVSGFLDYRDGLVHFDRNNPNRFL